MNGISASLVNTDSPDLFDIRKALKCFFNTVLLQGIHTLLDSLCKDVFRVGLVFDQLLYFLGPFH